MNRTEAHAILQEIEDRCNLLEKGREDVLWLEDASSWVDGVGGVAVAISVSKLDDQQVLDSISVATDNQKEVQVASRDDKVVMIIYTP